MTSLREPRHPGEREQIHGRDGGFLSLFTAMADASANRVEELGKQFLRALDPMRIHGLAMVNSEADVLWLSAGAMGPDEHALVAKSLDAFTVERDRPMIERRLEDHRRALFFAARDPFGGCCGLVFVLADARGGAEPPQAPGAHLQALLRRFSAVLAPPLTPKNEGEAAEGAAGSSAALGSPIHARKYARLQSGGATRRYEVLASGDDDAVTVERVAAWLTRNRGRYEQQPVVFTVVISAASAQDPAFLGKVKTALQRHQVERGRIGLGLPAGCWREHPRSLGRFLGECEAIGCSVTLDDYSLHGDAISLLRFPAVRCLKIDAALSTHALGDRYAQAELAAIVQAARVLGLHCVAKGVPSPAAAKWLAALGVDFADRLSDPRATGATTKSGELLALERVG